MSGQARVDIVTVAHRDSNYALAEAQRDRIASFEKSGDYTYTIVDNRLNNRGFALGCNQGAASGSSPFVFFLNPDAVVVGPFVELLVRVFDSPRLVITGERFGKPAHEIAHWKCDDWVCGAAMAVRRDWFEAHGGFWPEYFMFYEETDLIRQAQAEGKLCRSIPLPITHTSPDTHADPDATMKARFMHSSLAIYNRRWP